MLVISAPANVNGSVFRRYSATWVPDCMVSKSWRAVNGVPQVMFWNPLGSFIINTAQRGSAAITVPIMNIQRRINDEGERTRLIAFVRGTARRFASNATM
jgi:hypothetical protein